METNFITAILVMATNKNSRLTAHKVCEQIANYIGRLNCKIHDEIAIIRYEGILSSKNKATLQEVAKTESFALLFLEVEDTVKWITDETIHVPSKNEMREHLICD